jgi:hypothetical protein
MLGIRAAFREDRDFSPAEAMFGTHLILPDQFVDTAVISQGSADHHGWPLTTAYTTQLSSGTSISSGGAVTGPLHPGPPRQGAAAAGPHLQQPLCMLEKSTHFQWWANR